MQPFNFKFTADVGGNFVEISGTAESHQDFIKALSFFTTLPKEGPNGEKDLEFQYRLTKEGYDYYSLVSQEAGMEFQLGQSQKEKGVLFPKEWTPLHDSLKAKTSSVKGLGASTETTKNIKPSNTSSKGLAGASKKPSLNISGLGTKKKEESKPETETQVPADVKSSVDVIKAKYGISGL